MLSNAFKYNVKCSRMMATHSDGDFHPFTPLPGVAHQQIMELVNRRMDRIDKMRAKMRIAYRQATISAEGRN